MGIYPIVVVVLIIMAGLKAEDREEAEETPTPVSVEDREARRILKEERVHLRSQELRHRVESLQRIAGYQNEEFVKPLLELLEDEEERVVHAAIHALGSQPFDKSQQALLKIVLHPKYDDQVALREQALAALGRAGWSAAGYRKLREAFDEAHPKVKRGILRAFAAQQELNAFSLFVDHLDEPKPVNVNAANNPPASYWKERYKEWQFFKLDVHRGLEAMTGQSFASAAAAKEWAASKAGRKLGVRYKRGS